MKNVIIAILLLTTIYSCKKEKEKEKEKEKQFSTWYVNGHKFTTNDVGVADGKAIYILSTNNYDLDSNGFQIAINYGVIQPMHWLDCATDMCFKIKYNDNFYVGKLPGRVTSSFNNEKNSFKLNETWFYNSNRPDEDSVLVKGIFSEP